MSHQSYSSLTRIKIESYFAVLARFGGRVAREKETSSHSYAFEGNLQGEPAVELLIDVRNWTEPLLSVVDVGERTISAPPSQT